MLPPISNFPPREVEPRMPAAMISLDYSGALDSAIGPTHGLTAVEIERAAVPIAQAVRRIESERPAGSHRYRDLPLDKAMLKTVEAAVRRRRAGVENLVVLGIGGSALGNIALQSALNPLHYNLLPAAK